MRDGVPGLALLYYALPLAVVTGLCALQCGLAALRRRRTAARVWLAAALACGAWWGAAEWRGGNPSAADAGVRVVFWNVCRGNAGWDGIAQRIAGFQPDIVALVEAGAPTDDLQDLWKRYCPGYEVAYLGDGMLCLVRGSCVAVRERRLDGYSQARELDVEIDGMELRCLIVDVYADLLYDRRFALEWIAQIADECRDRPLLVLGDFNTPVDSVHFAALRAGHVNAFERAGSGCISTWPMPCPVLSLDQIWCNRYVRPLSCRHEGTLLSDHRCVIVAAAIDSERPRSPPEGT